MTERLLSVSSFPNAHSNRPNSRNVSWEFLAAILTEHKERASKDGPLWSPNHYPANTTRGWSFVKHVSCLVADIDKDADIYTVDVIERMLSGYSYAIHSTYSHREDDYKFRVIVPLGEDIPAGEWGKVWDRWQALFAHLRIKLDASCKDASRIYYLPSCAPGAQRFSTFGDGSYFDLGFMPEVDYSASVKAYNNPARHAPQTGEGVKAETLLRRAIDLARGQGHRNDNGLWLACQLRDNGYDEASAEGILRQYVESVCGLGANPYRYAEAASSVKSAYKRPARQPWTPSGEGRTGRGRFKYAPASPH